MRSLLPEIRVALRRALATPSTSIPVTVVLALGIGAALLASIAVEGILMRPLPYPQPDRLLVLRGTVGAEPAGGVSLLDFHDLREGASSLTRMAAFRRRSFLLAAGDPDASRVVQAGLSTAGLPATLGLIPPVGRDFTAEEARDGSAVTVLAWETARRLFATPEAALGESISLNDEPHRIVGVLPEGGEVWIDGHVVELLVPIDPSVYGGNRSVRSLTAVGRLDDGVAIEGARRELTGLAARLAEVHPDTNSDRGIAVVTLDRFLRGDNRAPLTLLAVGAGLLLLAAVVNAGSLLLESTLARTREIGVRRYLGAAWSDLAGQFVVETVLLATFGGIAGWSLAAAGLRILPRALAVSGGAPEVLALEALALEANGQAILLAAGLSLAVAVVLALGLMLAARRATPGAMIRFGVESRGATRTRRLLVGGQVAVSVTLLLGASLLGFAFLELVSVDPGFRVDGIARFGIGIPASRYPTEESMIEFHRRLERELEEIPAVTAGGILANLPFGGSGYSTWYVPAAIDLPRPQRPATGINVVSPGAFNALELPLIRGRLPGWSDGPDSPRIAVVDQTLADEWIGDDEPLGARVRIGWFSGIHPADSEWEIVGVVGSIRDRGLGDAPRPMLYLSASQFPVDGGNYVLRLRPGATLPATAVAEAVRDVDPGLERIEPEMLSRRLARSLGGERTTFGLAAALAGLALLLTCTGIYGLVGVEAARRGREMAVRRAVGATGSSVARLLVGSTLRIASAGIVLGCVAFLPLSGLLRSRLGNTEPAAPEAVVVALACVLLSCLLAALPAARRAARQSPVRIMRHD